MFTQKPGSETILKKYHNRRLYDPTRNCHVTLSELADRVKAGEQIRIVDNQTGEDITNTIMGQVLYETLKTRPDYLPLDLVLLMIRAQDNMVRDFLFNGLPYAFQMYLEHQRRMMSGMNWMSPGFSNPLAGFGTGFSGLFGGTSTAAKPAPAAPPSASTSGASGAKTAAPDELRSEIDRLRQEIRELRESAPPSRKLRSGRPKPDVR